MAQVTHKTVGEIIELSRLLGEFGQMRRATSSPYIKMHDELLAD